MSGDRVSKARVPEGMSKQGLLAVVQLRVSLQRIQADPGLSRLSGDIIVQFPYRPADDLRLVDDEVCLLYTSPSPRD